MANMKEHLTKREQQVLELVAIGYSNKEVGEQLYISHLTVKTHLTRIFDRLQVNNRIQAVRKAMRLGLVPFPN